MFASIHKIKYLNLIGILVCLVFLNPLHSDEVSESKKIHYLLDEIRNSGLIFIRNHSEYPAHKAAEHLEMKWNNAGKHRINTAQRFIDYLATKSSMSGEPYYIKYKNGKKIPSKIWLEQKLNQLENANP